MKSVSGAEQYSLPTQPGSARLISTLQMGRVDHHQHGFGIFNTAHLYQKKWS
jgi:hypothetical protein